MTITNEVASLDSAVKTAITNGLSTMGVANVDVIVTMDFIPTVQKLTGNSSYYGD